MRQRNTQRELEWKRSMRAQRRAAGLCSRHDNCPQLAISGKTLCEKHKAENAERNKAMYQRCLSSDMCVDCKRRPKALGITRCEECSARHSGLSGKHGATIEQRRKLLTLQAGRCAICRREIDALANADHDHATGRIRGLLCGRCNKAMGWFKDDPCLLRAAADYLDPLEWIGACGRIA